MLVGVPSSARYPLGITTCGCPVRFVSRSIGPPKLGVTTTSIPSIARSKRCMAIVRSRFAWMYSTAGIMRALRKVLGHAPPVWRTSRSSRPLRVSSSKAAPASALRMIRIAPYGMSSGSSSGTGSIPSPRTTSSEASSNAFHSSSSRSAPKAEGTYATRRSESGRSASQSKVTSRAVGSIPSAPWIACRTRAQSSTPRQIGPSLSIDHESAIAPARLTRPKVGRSPEAPQRVEGETIEPSVSLPIVNPTSPATTAEAEPAEEPLDPCSRFHGFFVCPPYQRSPCASAPRVSFATSTAPASSSRRPTVESSGMCWSSYGLAPHVVR